MQVQSQESTILDREPNSSLYQLLRLLANKDPAFDSWLKGKTTYTSPDCQNEIIDIMGRIVQRKLVKDVQANTYYTILADESPDCSNKEQAVFCVRYVDKDLEAHEEFLGLYQVARTDAKSLVSFIKDVLCRLDLKLEHCRGQCYDGAAVMSGSRNGVVTQIMEANPKAFYVHCYAHSLNLAIQDATKSCPMIKYALNITSEITKLVKASPKRETWLETLKQQHNNTEPGKLQKFSFTRWTVRASSMKGVLDNYRSLMELFHEIEQESSDSEVATKVAGVLAKMKQRRFLFGLCLAKKMYSITDALSKSLQSPEVSASRARELAVEVSQMLERMRKEKEFDKFLQEINQLADQLGVDEPEEARKRRMSKRYDEHNTTAVSLTTRESYRLRFYGFIDQTVGLIRSRFDQRGMSAHIALEHTVFNASSSLCTKQNMEQLKDFYGSDFHYDMLQTELAMLSKASTPINNIEQLIGYVKPRCSLFPQLYHMARLLLLMPGSNAVSERSFSAMNRVKTSYRSTMVQSRLNSLMLLHAHSRLTDSIDVNEVIDTFISGHYRRAYYINTK